MTSGMTAATATRTAEAVSTRRHDGSGMRLRSLRWPNTAALSWRTTMRTMKSMIAGTVSTVIQLGRSSLYWLAASRATPRISAPTAVSGRLRRRPTMAAA